MRKSGDSVPSSPAKKRPWEPPFDGFRMRMDTQLGSAFTVRVTPAERDQLLEAARDFGLSISAYCRRTLLDRPLPPRRPVIPEVNRQVYADLGRLGGILNQMARRLNERSGDEDDTRAILEAIVAVAELLHQTRRELLREHPGGPA